MSDNLFWGDETVISEVENYFLVHQKKIIGRKQDLVHALSEMDRSLNYQK